jgi:hypothetical protein
MSQKSVFSSKNAKNGQKSAEPLREKVKNGQK